jgi:hypothetical protein
MICYWLYIVVAIVKGELGLKDCAANQGLLLVERIG